MCLRGQLAAVCLPRGRDTGRWGAGSVRVKPRLQSSRPGSSVLSVEKASEKGRQSIARSLRHGRILIFLGICLGCPSHCILSPHTRPARGAGREKRKGRDLRRLSPGGSWAGGEQEGTCSPPVKPSLNHKTPSPQALVSFCAVPTAAPAITV